MIVKMQKLFLYGLYPDSTKVLAQLLKMGCAQIENPERLPEYEQLAQLMQYKAADLYELEQQISRFTSAISALSPHAPKRGLFTAKPRVGFGCMGDSGLVKKADEICAAVEAATRTIADLKSRISKEEFTKASLIPWERLDIPLELTETGRVLVEYLILPSTADAKALQEELDGQGLTACLYEQATDKDSRYALLLMYKDDRQAVWDILRAQGASRGSFEGMTGTPRDNMIRCDKAVEECRRNIEFTTGQLQELGAQADAVKLGYDILKMRFDCARAYQKLMHTDKTFLLFAWVPAGRAEEVAGYLDNMDCYYEFIQPDKREDFPIQLKNSKLVEPFEVITEMYSLPAAGSVDPDPFVAIFYFIFFGMMLSDAGYGLLLLFGGLFALWKLDLSPFARKFMKMISLGGFSTVIWGAAYGSWFGNLIPQVALTFFGKEVTVPMLLDPLGDPITILIISFGLGIVHLMVGMGLKAYLLIKRGHVWDAVFDVFFWYGVFIGLGMIFLPGVFSTLGKVLAIGSVAGLILTQGRDKKNIFMRLISGVMSLYDITGYFSDVLSYSRILALGLATGVIAQVVNIMGTLPGANVVGVVMFIVVFCFGHLLNLAINALGSYVHASRLQYVEFFGKFYEGGGKPFSPLRANTKYVFVTDEKEPA